MHVHGLDDGTVPMAGRRLGGGFKQGDVMRGLAVWRAVDRCGTAEPEIEPARDDLTCRRWVGCGSGRELRLCLHGGGHELKPAWIAGAFAFVRRVAGR
ncbi:MAG: hypothetical protein JO048_08130 [Methylobacteriaceae bacterium]|nr:hypothetical protein [Methylobacteriaceae bacterium]